MIVSSEMKRRDIPPVAALTIIDEGGCSKFFSA
jgi:hypothetical protein